MRFEVNPNLAADFAADPEIERMLLATAWTIAQRAAMLMPVGPDPHLGHIRDFFRGGRADGHIVAFNTHPFFHLAEFGSRNNPAYAPLRRAVISLGMLFGADSSRT